MYQLEELSLEVTNECTLSCIHCSSGSSPKRLPGELTLLEHQVLIEQARELGATVLSLSGGNPLLSGHLLRLIDRAIELEYGRILIYTTGHNRHGLTIDTWMDIDKVMVYPQVTWIFSLHSHNALRNNLIMEYGAHDDIIRSIKYLIDNNQSVEVHMVPMKPNYRDIRELRDLCAMLGVKKLSLLRFVPQTRGFNNLDVLGMSKAEFIEMQVIIDKEKRRESKVELRTGCPIDFRHSLGLLSEKAKPCHAGDDLMLVRPDGDVHPCAAWKSLPADSNVRTSTLAEIWENSTTFEYIRRFKRNDYTSHDDYDAVAGCYHCSKVHTCKTGCLAQRLHAYDGGGGIGALLCEWSDPLCPIGSQPCDPLECEGCAGDKGCDPC